MAIYCKIPNVSGDVSTTNFKNWIQIDDIEFAGASKSAEMKVGKSIDRNIGFPKFSQVTVIKTMDSSSNALFQALHDNRVFNYIEFNYVSSGNTPSIYGKLILHHVMVTHFGDKHNSEAQRPRELIRLAYTQMQRTVIPHDNTGKAGSADIAGYDLEAAKKM